jgi:hypothetical protein
MEPRALLVGGVILLDVGLATALFVAAARPATEGPADRRLFAISLCVLFLLSVVTGVLISLTGLL